MLAGLVCWKESHELNYKVGIQRLGVELHDCMLELFVGDLHVSARGLGLTDIEASISIPISASAKPK